jgi:hypothetical protein
MAALRRTRLIIFWCALVTAQWIFNSAVLRAADKAPVPAAEAQNAALKLVKDVYGEEYAKAESPEQKTALAQKLLETAKGTNGGTANHYALLRVAWDVATQAGDAKLAMQITDEIAGVYEVNALSAKVATVKTTDGFVRTSKQRMALATIALELAEEAAAGDDYHSAEELASIGIAAARKAQDWGLVKETVAREKQIKQAAEAYAKIQAVLATLEANPTDPAANQAAGEYFCFVKGDWGKGIPMLALGNDEAFRALAQKDLKRAGTPEEQVELGDGWWDLAQANEGKRREILLLRAGSWYGAAKAGALSGLTLAKVEKRLKEIEKDGRPVAGAKPGASGTTTPVGVIADAVVLWNTRNGIHVNSGTLACNLVLLRGGSTVWEKKGIRMPWSAKMNPNVIVQLPKRAFDTLRVEIVAWYDRAGGLSEIEVYRGNQNIARNRPVRASGHRDPRFRPNRVADGIIQKTQNYVGYWLLPGLTPGWIEIDFSDGIQKK